MSSKHFIQSNPHVGYWVNCSREQECPLIHVDSELFNLTKTWKEQNFGKRISNQHVRLADVETVKNLTEGELQKLETLTYSRAEQKLRGIRKHQNVLSSVKLYETISISEDEQLFTKSPTSQVTQMVGEPVMTPKLVTSSTDFVLNVLDAANHPTVGEKIVYPLQRELEYYAPGSGYLRDTQIMALIKNGITFNHNYKSKTVTVTANNREQLNLIAAVELENIITQQVTVAKKMDSKQNVRPLTKKLKNRTVKETPNIVAFNVALENLNAWAVSHDIKIG